MGATPANNWLQFINLWHNCALGGDFANSTMSVVVNFICGTFSKRWIDWLEEVKLHTGFACV
tara:strand:+ start:126 stop:311 length:186 start_codon:yes stop_codon:yes gene_type:complete